MEYELANRIKETVQDFKEDMVLLVEELAKAESPSTLPSSQNAVFKILSDSFIDLDYEVIRVFGKNTGGYLYARPKKRNKEKAVQLLVGHCDTVWPIDTIKTMPVISEEGRIKGPGVYDMKGGLTQIVFALRTLRKLGIQPVVMPIVLINSDEEIGSKESTQAISRLSKLADRAFILEPSLGVEGKLKTQRKGVGRFTIKVRGKSAHAGLDPTKGASAIVELSHLIQELFKMNDPEKNISVNVGMIEGGVRPNVIAPESSAVIDVRVPTQKDAERITAQIHNLKPVQENVHIEIDGRIGRPPMEATPANRKLWKKAHELGTFLDIELKESSAGGASDGNTTSLFTATLDGLGATGDGAHAPHEFMFIDKMIERTALLTLLMLREPLNIQITAS